MKWNDDKPRSEECGQLTVQLLDVKHSYLGCTDQQVAIVETRFYHHIATETQQNAGINNGEADNVNYTVGD